MDISEPYELEDSMHEISEKDLSMINKSHPDDKVVSQPRIIKPPKPAIKLPKALNYQSLDSAIKDPYMHKAAKSTTEKDKNQGNLDFDKYRDQSPLRPRKPPLAHQSGGKYSSERSKNTLKFHTEGNVQKMGSDELLRRGGEVSSKRFKEEEDIGFRAFMASPENFKENPLYKKMAEKIRSQAKRIVEIEMKASKLEKRARLRDEGVISTRRSREGAEVDLLRKQNSLLEEENNALREKIEILNRTVVEEKERKLSEFEGEEKEKLYITKISDMEANKIELEEVLKQECIKNEKLESMIELLRRMNEEKLEKVGFLPINGLDRVDSLIDASHVYENNEKLIKEVESLRADFEDLSEENEGLKRYIGGVEKKCEFLVAFKAKADAEVIEVKRRELVLIKQVNSFLMILSLRRSRMRMMSSGARLRA